MNGELSMACEEEVSAKVVDDWLEECMEHFNRLPAEERAYRVIRTYMSLEEPDDAIYNQFIGWYLDSRNAEAKEKAMDRIFCEMFCKNERYA